MSIGDKQPRVRQKMLDGCHLVGFSSRENCLYYKLLFRIVTKFFLLIRFYIPSFTHNNNIYRLYLLDSFNCTSKCVEQVFCYPASTVR